MTIERKAAITNHLQRVLAALNSAAIVRYEHKVMIGVLLAITAFVPALGIAAIALSAISNEQNNLALLYYQENTIVQNMNSLLLAEDALMPLFILTDRREFLNKLHQNEYDFDTVLTQLRTSEAPNSHAQQLLEAIAHLSQLRRARMEPGIAMRIQGEPTQSINHYFEQNDNVHDVSADLHHSVDAFMRLTTARFQDFVARHRQRLHNVSMMLLAAGGFAIIISFGVSMLILRLLQAKKQHDAALAREADWQRALADARKEAVETVAHDLRQPLQVMMFVAEKLQRGAAGQRSAHTSLDGFISSAAAMRGLIDTVLNPANIGVEALPIFKKPLNLQLMLLDLGNRFYTPAD